MKTKLTVTVDGHPITRTTANAYRFVVVAYNDRAHAYQVADERGLVDAQMRRNFAHFESVAKHRESHEFANIYRSQPAALAEWIAKADAVVAMGLAGYAADLRDQAIASVDRRAAAGAFDTPGALRWTTRRDLAEKEAARAKATGIYNRVQIVEVAGAAS